MDPALFPARVEDTAALCERTAVPHFLGFLTEEERASASALLLARGVKFGFFGGFAEADRQMLCCYPDWCEDPSYPIAALTFRYRACDRLTHRDFLGSLMALGITRESVGDILVGEGLAVVFCDARLASYLRSQVETVGRVGVTVTEGAVEPLPGRGEKIECHESVASLRLDAVTAAVFGLSRSAATEAIASGRVTVGGAVCEKPTHTVESGDRLALRGKGRVEIGETQGRSKKGRIVLQYYQWK